MSRWFRITALHLAPVFFGLSGGALGVRLALSDGQEPASAQLWILFLLSGGVGSSLNIFSNWGRPDADRDQEARKDRWLHLFLFVAAFAAVSGVGAFVVRGVHWANLQLNVLIIGAIFITALLGACGLWFMDWLSKKSERYEDEAHG